MRVMNQIVIAAAATLFFLFSGVDTVQAAQDWRECVESCYDTEDRCAAECASADDVGKCEAACFDESEECRKSCPEEDE